MVSLNAFVMIDSTLDLVVQPEQSGCFAFWANNSNTGASMPAYLEKGECRTIDWLSAWSCFDERVELKCNTIDSGYL